MRNPYEVLGVRKNATAKTIKKAYRQLATEHHPDRNPGDESAQVRSAEINEAYAILSDPERRKRFDETGQTRQQPPASHEISSVLVPILFAVMDAHFGRLGKIEDADLIAQMKDQLRSQQSTVEGAIAKMKKAVVMLETVAGRLSIEGEDEDFLSGAVRSRLAGTQEQLGIAERDRDKLKRAADYLAKCKYRRDIAKVSSLGFAGMTGSAAYTPAGFWTGPA